MQEQDRETGSRPNAGASAERRRAPRPFDSPAAARAVLSSQCRRDAIELLCQAGGTLSIGQLANQITSKQLKESSTQERQRMYVRLSRTHVPVLERQGVVEYSDTMGVVSLSVSTDRVRDLLQWDWGGTPDASPDMDTTVER